MSDEPETIDMSSRADPPKRSRGLPRLLPSPLGRELIGERLSLLRVHLRIERRLHKLRLLVNLTRLWLRPIRRSKKRGRRSGLDASRARLLSQTPDLGHPHRRLSLQAR